MNKKNIVKVIILVVIVVILACATFIFWPSKQNPKVSLENNYLGYRQGIDLPELSSAQIEKEMQIDIQKNAIKNAIVAAFKRYPGEGGSAGGGIEPPEGIIIERKVPEVIRPSDGSENWQQFVERIIGYQVDTPSWIILRNDLSPHCGQNCTPIEDLLIQNQPYVGPPGSGPEDGSVLQLRIWEYSIADLTIRKWIENLDIPEQDKQQRIDRIKNVEIGGINREVSTGLMDVDWQKGVTFVGGNRVYDFTYFSGSNTQFAEDLSTFSRMLTSFVVIPPLDLGNKVYVLNNGSSKEKMDILFIPQGITDFSLFKSRIEDILYRSGNDIYDVPFVNLLNVEPFKSYKNKLNVFYADKNIDEAFFGCPTQDLDPAGDGVVFTCSRGGIGDIYKFFDYDYIVVVFTRHGYTSNASGDIQYLEFNLSQYREYSSFEETFIHELGHQLGLADEYVLPESPSRNCGNAMYGPKSGQCFEEYAKIVKLYPNLDTLGCPKWCQSYDLSKDDILMRDNEVCSQIQTAEECKKNYPINNCTWFNMKHPFFNANCVAIRGTKDIGINCLEDTQCVLGGDYGQLAFNPGLNIMNSYSTKLAGPSIDHIQNILNCCYPYQGSEVCKNFINQFKGLDGVGLSGHFVKAYRKIGYCDIN